MVHKVEYHAARGGAANTVRTILPTILLSLSEIMVPAKSANNVN